MTSSTLSLLLPHYIVEGRFEVLSLTGAGGMGEVYRARDIESGASLALKVMRGVTSHQRDRLLREARVLAQLRHPGIVGYVAHGRLDDDGVYLAIEWLDGVELRARLAEGPLEVSSALRIGVQLAAALAAAHARGIVHCDLKPSNIFLVGDETGIVKLLDFGIAQLDGVDARRTSGDVIEGTPLYMAPEQWRGRHAIDARADVFGLGVVLYECLTGEMPFRGGFESSPAAPSALVPTVPAAIDELVLRMIDRDPRRRLEDGAAVLSALLATSELHTFDVKGRGLSSAEQRVESVIAIGRPCAASVETGVPGAFSPVAHAATSITPVARRVIEAIAAAHGARLTLVGDGMTLAIVTDGIATDLASRAVRCALAISNVARVPVSVATGRAASRAPIRYAPSELVHGAVAVDGVTGGLLPARFTFSDAGGLVVIGEQEGADEGPRLLLGRPAPFVGREQEITRLVDELDACAESGPTRIVLVTSPAGIGKTRLRVELAAELRRRGRDVQLWLGRAEPMRTGSPFGLLADVIRRVAAIQAGDPIPVQRDRLRARVAERVPHAELDRVSGFLAEAIGAATALDDDALRIARLDPTAMADGMRRAWIDWVSAEARAEPLAIVLEDLQWSDAATLRLLEDLRASDAGCLVIALARPELHDLAPHLIGAPRVTELVLSPLARRDAYALAASVLAERCDRTTIERVVDLGGGHPLYLEELVRHVVEHGHTGLPDTVLAMLQTRLAALEPDARLVLRAASVFGETAWTGGIAALVADTIAPAQLADGLEGLATAELLDRRATSRLRGEHEWQFRHALVRDAAYGMLADADRVVGHRLAGQWLAEVGEPNHGLLAEHLLRGHDWANAVAHLERANREAMAAEAMEEAARYYEQARTAWRELPETSEVSRRRVELLLAQLPVALTQLDFPRYHTLLREQEAAVVGLGNTALLGTWHARLGAAGMALGRLGEAMRDHERAIELLESADAHEEAGYAWQSWMFNHVFLGDLADTLRGLAPLETHLARAPNPRWHTFGLGAAAMACIGLARWSAAIAHAERGVALAEASGQPGVRSFAAWVLAYTLAYAGDPDRALDAGTAALSVSVTLGDRLWAACAHAIARYRLGDPAPAAETLGAALVAMRGKFAAGEVFAAAHVDALAALGRTDDARTAATRMYEVAVGHGMRLNAGVARRWLGILAETDEVASASFAESERWLTPIGATHELALVDAARAVRDARAGRSARARIGAARARAALAALRSPWRPRDLDEIG